MRSASKSHRCGLQIFRPQNDSFTCDKCGFCCRHSTLFIGEHVGCHIIFQNILLFTFPQLKQFLTRRGHRRLYLKVLCSKTDGRFWSQKSISANPLSNGGSRSRIGINLKASSLAILAKYSPCTKKRGGPRLFWLFFASLKSTCYLDTTRQDWRTRLFGGGLGGTKISHSLLQVCATPKLQKVHPGPQVVRFFLGPRGNSVRAVVDPFLCIFPFNFS